MPHLGVFATEPLRPASQFRDLPDVLISPDSAAPWDGTGERVAAVSAENLRRWTRGQTLVSKAEELG